MAPAQKTTKTTKTEDDAKASQNTVIKQFFKRKNLGRCPDAHVLCTDAIGIVGGVKRKRGPVLGDGASRKKKKVKGYTVATATAPPAEKRHIEPNVCPSTLKPKSRRINWELGEALDGPINAVHDWDAATDSSLDDNKVKVSLWTYAVAVRFENILHYIAAL
jgi:hypothetical protein